MAVSGLRCAVESLLGQGASVAQWIDMSALSFGENRVAHFLYSTGGLPVMYGVVDWKRRV